MARWIALLRGVNLGRANRVAMADVRAAFTALGWRQVRSIGQSGNLLFEADGVISDLEESGETVLRDRLRLKTFVVVRSAPTWQAMIAANPFAAEAAADPARLVAVMLKGSANPAAEAALAALSRRERARVIDHTAYIYYPDGQAGSPVAGAGLDRALGTPGTARNWNTVLKLAEAVAG